MFQAGLDPSEKKAGNRRRSEQSKEWLEDLCSTPCLRPLSVGRAQEPISDHVPDFLSSLRAGLAGH